MISSFLLAAVLAGTPAPEPVPERLPVPDRAQLPVAANPASLDVPITLHLKDSSLVDLLEKMADLLGVTPILEPGLAGLVNLDLDETPLSKALAEIERQTGTEITISGRALRARWKDGAQTAGVTPASIQPRPGAVGEVLRFWMEGAEDSPLVVRVPAYVGRIDLPGCREPVTIAPLGPFGGKAYGVAMASRDGENGRPMARILYGAAAEGRKLLLPGCDAKLVAEGGDVGAATDTVEPRRVDKGESLVAAIRLLEVTEEREEILSAPKIAFPVDSGFSVKSGWDAAGPSASAREFEVHGAALVVREADESALFAVIAQVTSTPPAAGGGVPRSVRRAESFLLRKGRPVRWTLDSSWDGGRAALVLEITLMKNGTVHR